MTATGDWYERIPKVELHVHIEGSIPLPALWQIMGKYGGHEEVGSMDALVERFRFRDFPHFIATWLWKDGYLRELEDFTLLAEAVARELRAQNIRYAEAFYSPGGYARHGLAVGDITCALRDGLDRVDGIEVALIADLIRDNGPEEGARTLDAVAEVRERGVIGIGIGGSEQSFPPAPYAAVYERARALGLRTSAHAGEAAGPASIWDALRALRVDRIGHGTRASEDPALVDYLADSRTAIEMCPISNLRTGVVPDLAAHPIRSFFERGLLVTVNTDDPAMFHTSLAHEYRELARVHGFTRDELRALIDNAVAASWLDDAGKAALRSTLRADPAWSE
ncbi:adenosine deaminase [Haliangium ochraceum]|uniref:Adenosine deaminase n=1 Tax=Haliangium ochraceum (strain DSM 14365 / JCM 11303 / SMP-2) TaxID=502025 RepID=D0LIZ7_HALO1|nr:adenosine deaminase [Haliangium ochraceum]ACY13026.1 adenosine deaminase [Haliangium ochraceum DSM 14365]